MAFDAHSHAHGVHGECLGGGASAPVDLPILPKGWLVRAARASFRSKASRGLSLFLALNVMVVVVEVLCAAYAGSLALMCDAVSMAFGCTGLIINSYP